MDHSPADILRYALIALSGGTLPTANGSWPIFVETEPDSPDKCITIYDTEGRMDGTNQINGEMYEHPGVQVRIRSTDHTTGWAKADAIRTLLDQSILTTNVTIGATTYNIQAIDRTGNINMLGKQVQFSDLRLFTINAVMAVRQL